MVPFRHVIASEHILWLTSMLWANLSYIDLKTEPVMMAQMTNVIACGSEGGIAWSARELTCRQDLSDKPRLASQHVQARRTILSTASFSFTVGPSRSYKRGEKEREGERLCFNVY